MWVGGMIVWAGFVSQGLEDHPKETGLSPRSRDVFSRPEGTERMMLCHYLSNPAAHFAGVSNA